MYGEEIDKRINRLGLSNMQVAKAVGVKPSEIIDIRYDRRNTINKSIFLKLMEALSLNPRDFGGFVKINLLDKDDFINGEEFIKAINHERITRKIPFREISRQTGISNNILRAVLSLDNATIHINNLAKLSEYFKIDYQPYLVNKEIVPKLSHQEILLKIKEKLTELNKSELEELLNYTKEMLEDHHNLPSIDKIFTTINYISNINLNGKNVELKTEYQSIIYEDGTIIGNYKSSTIEYFVFGRMNKEGEITLFQIDNCIIISYFEGKINLNNCNLDGTWSYANPTSYILEKASLDLTLISKGQKDSFYYSYLPNLYQRFDSVYKDASFYIQNHLYELFQDKEDFIRNNKEDVKRKTLNQKAEKITNIN